jgi:protein arginine N-methyltransferase 1
VAPVISDRLHKELTVWDEVGHGLDLSAARTMSLNNVYVRTLEGGELLDGGKSARAWDTVDLTRETRSTRKGETSWKLGAPATIYGFAYWWTAELAPGITLSTAPGAPRTHWEQLYFPLMTPITAQKGEAVMASLRSRSSEAAGTHLAWTGVHCDASGKSLSRQAMSLDKGWIP